MPQKAHILFLLTCLFVALNAAAKCNQHQPDSDDTQKKSLSPNQEMNIKAFSGLADEFSRLADQSGIDSCQLTVKFSFAEDGFPKDVVAENVQFCNEKMISAVISKVKKLQCNAVADTNEVHRIPIDLRIE